MGHKRQKRAKKVKIEGSKGRQAGEARKYTAYLDSH